ncbi:MAG: hypothetical protein J6W53_02405, partial [Candidatus Methanomethylophilaceae archaeon]|nr:hypothetical protein [Candidatus Methanomethylophilaceae archaeon]
MILDHLESPSIVHHISNRIYNDAFNGTVGDSPHDAGNPLLVGRFSGISDGLTEIGTLQNSEMLAQWYPSSYPPE